VGDIFNHLVLISFSRLILLLDKETLRLLADNPRVCAIMFDSYIVHVCLPTKQEVLIITFWKSGLEYKRFAVSIWKTCVCFFL